MYPKEQQNNRGAAAGSNFLNSFFFIQTLLYFKWEEAEEARPRLEKKKKVWLHSETENTHFIIILFTNVAELCDHFALKLGLEPGSQYI